MGNLCVSSTKKRARRNLHEFLSEFDCDQLTVTYLSNKRTLYLRTSRLDCRRYRRGRADDAAASRKSCPEWSPAGCTPVAVPCDRVDCRSCSRNSFYRYELVRGGKDNTVRIDELRRSAEFFWTVQVEKGRQLLVDHTGEFVASRSVHRLGSIVMVWKLQIHNVVL